MKIKDFFRELLSLPEQASISYLSMMREFVMDKKKMDSQVLEDIKSKGLYISRYSIEYSNKDDLEVAENEKTQFSYCFNKMIEAYIENFDSLFHIIIESNHEIDCCESFYLLLSKDRKNLLIQGIDASPILYNMIKKPNQIPDDIQRWAPNITKLINSMSLDCCTNSCIGLQNYRAIVSFPYSIFTNCSSSEDFLSSCSSKLYEVHCELNRVLTKSIRRNIALQFNGQESLLLNFSYNEISKFYYEIEDLEDSIKTEVLRNGYFNRYKSIIYSDDVIDDAVKNNVLDYEDLEIKECFRLIDYGDSLNDNSFCFHYYIIRWYNGDEDWIVSFGDDFNFNDLYKKCNPYELRAKLPTISQLKNNGIRLKLTSGALINTLHKNFIIRRYHQNLDEMSKMKIQNESIDKVLEICYELNDYIEYLEMKEKTDQERTNDQNANSYKRMASYSILQNVFSNLF